jgi:hypothetical protein
LRLAKYEPKKLSISLGHTYSNVGHILCKRGLENVGIPIIVDCSTLACLVVSKGGKPNIQFGISNCTYGTSISTDIDIAARGNMETGENET